MKRSIPRQVAFAVVGVFVLLTGLFLWRTYRGGPEYDPDAYKDKPLPPLITAKHLKPPPGMSPAAAMTWTAQQRAKEAEERSRAQKK